MDSMKINETKDDVIVGPDIDCSKSPLDKKLYRQILLPNGLRVVLIQDTNAMHELSSSDRYSHLEEDDDDDEDDSEGCDAHSSTTNTADEEDTAGIRKAGAAMVVGCGSFHDPPQFMGLAHFCEHMLFMGSNKYPTENALDSFLSHNGGSSNAYTQCEYTVYHFDVLQDYLEEALDMFAQFFISPLFLPDAVDREIQAIESEFNLNKNTDSNRLEMLLSHTCGKPHHPIAKFPWGNTHSLQQSGEASSLHTLLQELRTFYHTHYYASNMSLVVMGAYTLDDLQAQVIKCCSMIPPSPRYHSSNSEMTLDYHSRKNISSSSYSSSFSSSCVGSSWESLINHQIRQNIHTLIAHGMPFADSALRKLYRIIPVKDSHILQITWQIPPQASLWKSKPTDYVGHLMGHESKGSILSACKEQNWVTSCSAGLNSFGGIENASSHGLFTITFTLTKSGVSHWEQVVHTVYQYIGMLVNQRHMPNYIFDELQKMNKATYQYQEDVSTDEFVEEIADRLAPCHALLPPERLLDGYELLWEYDECAIRQLIERYLTPSNARYDLMSSTFGRAADYNNNDNVMDDTTTLSKDKDRQGLSEEKKDNDLIPSNTSKVAFNLQKTPQVEPYFGTRFWVEEICSDTLSRWALAFQNGTSDDVPLSLPSPNPFVPTAFNLKPRPFDDSHHPLLRCSVKIQVTVGKKKEWYPATVSKYNLSQNLLELVYEDHGIRHHYCDMTITQRTSSSFIVQPDMTGTLDRKQTKFKVVDVSGSNTLKYGDESDLHVDQGTGFPHIPPPSPPSRLPSLVINQPGVKIWHAQDYKFQRPIAELRILIRCENVNKSPLERACADLMANLWQDALVETSYLAAVCELGSELNSTDVGFVIRVHGFDDKLLYLTKEILSMFCSFRVSSTSSNVLPNTIKPDRFDACLEVLRRSYTNAGLNASKLCTSIRLRCIRPTIWSSYSKLEALTTICVERFMSVVHSLLQRVAVEALYYGNCEKSDAVMASKIIQETIFKSRCGTLQKQKYPSQLVLKVPLSSAQTAYKWAVISPSLDPQEPNTAVEIYFQVGKDNVKDRVLVDLLCEIIHEPLFDKIRTKEQFGYEVFCAPRWTHGVIGISFKIVTASRSADEVSRRIEEFLLDFQLELVKMENSKFVSHLAGLASNKIQMYNSLEEECNVWWNEILDGRYDWEAHLSEALRLRSLTKEEVLAAYEDWLLPIHNGSPKQRRCLIVHVIGSSRGPSSQGRPVLASEGMGAQIDERVKAYHSIAKHINWGKILFSAPSI
jgi:nardilysin